MDNSLIAVAMLLLLSFTGAVILVRFSASPAALKKEPCLPAARLMLLVILVFAFSGCAVKLTSFPESQEVSKVEPSTNLKLYVGSVNVRGLPTAISDDEREQIKEVFISHIDKAHFFKSVQNLSMKSKTDKGDYIIVDADFTPRDEGGYNWWATFPAVYPMPAYWPLQIREGKVSVDIACTVYKEKEDYKINLSSNKSEDYKVKFYGFFKTKAIEDKLRKCYEDVMQDIVAQIVSDQRVLALLDPSGKTQPLRKRYETAALKPHAVPSYRKSDVDEFSAVKAKPRKNAHAIVIGIEQYRQKLPAADFAAHDARTVSEYLTKLLGYPEENVVLLLNENATKSDFEKYFERWLSNNVEEAGTVLVYYSGHGAPNSKTGDAYLVPYDGDPAFIEQTGYPLKKLYDFLGKLPAKEIIVVLDSCFSGAGGKSVIAKGSRPLVMNLEQALVPAGNMIVMSAAAGDQISATYEDKAHGLFTYFLLKGIKGEGGSGRDGKIEIRELYEYIRPHVERTARKLYNNDQTPQLMAPGDSLEKKKTFLRE